MEADAIPAAILIHPIDAQEYTQNQRQSQQLRVIARIVPYKEKTSGLKI
jgi:hypothetical protein